MANSEEIAAATIPRGPTQLIISFSLVFRLVPTADAHTASGRATNIATSSKITPLMPTAARLAKSMRAANTINSIEISSTVSDSLNSKI